MSLDDNTIQLKDGRTLGYGVYGDPQGKPLFFFHGWPSSRLSVKRIDEIAKNLHVRVISVDRPGYGLSDFKPNRTILDFANDVEQLADSLHIQKFPVIGVSGGGPYSAVCAYKLANRVTKACIIVGLAPTYIPGILDGMPLTFKLGWANYSKFPLLRTFGAGYHYINTKYGLSFGLYRFLFQAKIDRELLSREEVTRHMREDAQEAFRQGYIGAELDLKLYTTDWKFSLKDIKVPVYLWYGKDDKNVSLKMGKYYASQISNSKLTIYSGGHFGWVDHAEEIILSLK